MITRMYEITRLSGGSTYLTIDASEIVDPDDGTNYGNFIEDSDLDRICEHFKIEKKEFYEYLDTLR